MENSNRYNNEDFQSDSLHSQICSAGNIDFTYRKAYKGDWGHWDDLPDNTSKVNFAENPGSGKATIKGSAGPYENSYL